LMVKVLASTMRRIIRDYTRMTFFEGKSYVVTTLGGVPIYCSKDTKEMKIEEKGHTVIPLKLFGYPSISTMVDKVINREDLMQQATDCLLGLTDAERKEVIANVEDKR